MRSGCSIGAWITALLLFAGAGCAGPVASQPSVTLVVQADRPGVRVSPMLYGVFFEEINRAGDGGIYAEMIENRSFEDASTPRAWELVTSGNAEGSMALDDAMPLSQKNRHCLKLVIAKVGDGRVGVASDGFRGRGKDPYKGIAVTKGETYKVSLFARASDSFAGKLTVSLEARDGTTLAWADLPAPGQKWQTADATLTPTATTTEGRLVVWATTPGTVYLDMVSLMPTKTWKNHGLRPDLMEMLAALHPAFVRFPGGCWVEGARMATAMRWKDTIGPIEERRTLPNLWGYQSTNGLGFFEYLQVCEDLAAEPLFVINVGMSHGDVVPMSEMGEYVQDALDAIEYATGPSDSRWGSLRAKSGHPKPFGLKYMEIGNENGGPRYTQRHKLFVDAIRAKYPDVHLITDQWAGTPTRDMPVEILDEHAYLSPKVFYARTGQFDAYDRKGPRIYMGEYAVTQGCGGGNLYAALGEAAFMTGMERNSDVVTMASYAPLFAHIHHKGWNPDAINFDNARVYGTPSYYVQQMFATSRPDQVLPLEVACPTVEMTHGGMIGLGTWKTAAEFKDVRITTDGQDLVAPAAAGELSTWKRGRGSWAAADGVLRQTDTAVTDARIMLGEKTWQDYTIRLKARKTAGAEGFLVSFDLENATDVCWWNIGGWGNTGHNLEGDGFETTRMVPGRIETNRWYDIRVEVTGAKVRCFLDDKMIHEARRVSHAAVYGVAGKKGSEVIVKAVNTSSEPQEAHIVLRGMTRVNSGTATVLTSGSLTDENTLDAPRRVVPTVNSLKDVSPDFRYTLPAYSVIVLRLDSVP